MLLRFRPRTVLPLVRTPDHAKSRHLESVIDSNASLSVLSSRHQWLSHINEHSESGADIQRYRYVAAHVTSDELNELLVLTSLEQNYKKLALTMKLN